MESSNVLMDIDRITVKYPQGGIILKDLSLQVNQSEIVCVIGESGCGKSTLLNAILQLPGRVDVLSGAIRYEDSDILEMSQKDLSKYRGTKIGVVFQEPGASLDPIRKIKSQFYDAMKAHRSISKEASYKEAEEILKSVELYDTKRILESCPVQLSGGMNQRVAIAIAMALKPRLLLADEPTSALDVTVQLQIVEELLRLKEVYGTSILMITHNVGVVAKMADKVAVMYGGRVVEYGPRQDVLYNPRHPYTKALIEAIPKLDGTAPIGIPGSKPKEFVEKGCAFALRCKYAKEKCYSNKPEAIKVNDQHWTICNELAEDDKNE